VEVVSNSVLNGNWGFGTTDMFLDRSHMLPEISDWYKVFTLKGKFLKDPKFSFTLKPYANTTPAPNILLKEVNHVFITQASII
jgi:hypothetical protein